ncbi:hypothetical protein [Sulfitobacter sp. R18_1]|uniref:hypothetical protein n=1 Tax=Sulfitobacter sp. R18_1 TaxID=2821104 RepID=UPI001ADC1E5B|nr:hypothetical protein [Sulfitobacter sp. R18_1]MBO9428165.1 hypothetical protein [Sulfitobacter sp. R18_1]
MDTNERAIEGSVTQIKKACVIRPTALIEGACTRKVDEPLDAENWQYLAPGECLDITAGKAFILKNGHNWMLAQFYADGRFTGPIAFSDTQIEDPLKVWEEHTRAGYNASEIRVSLCQLLLAAFILSLAFSLKNIDATELLFCVVAFVVFTLLGGVRLWDTLRRDGISAFRESFPLIIRNRSAARRSIIKETKSKKIKVNNPVFFDL